MENIKQKSNVYEGVGPSDIEVYRLKNDDNWSKEISKTFIGEGVLDGARFLDLGAGSSTDMHHWAKEQGATRSLAVDVSEKMLEAREVGLNKTYDNLKSSVDNLEKIEDDSFDYTHMKLVLMHLDKATRQKAIEETIRVTKKKVFFIDGDWSTWGGTEVVDEFIQFLQSEINQYRQIDNYIGQKMPDEISQIAENLGCKVSRVAHFKNEKGNHYHYLINLAKGSYKKLIEEKVEDVEKKEELLFKLNNLVERLENEAESGQEIEMAQAVGVEVSIPEDVDDVIVQRERISEEEITNIINLQNKFLRTGNAEVDRVEGRYLSTTTDENLLHEMLEQNGIIYIEDHKNGALAGYGLLSSLDLAAKIETEGAFLETLKSLNDPEYTFDETNTLFYHQLCIDKPYQKSNIPLAIQEEISKRFSGKFKYFVGRIGEDNKRSLRLFTKHLGCRKIAEYKDGDRVLNILVSEL